MKASEVLRGYLRIRRVPLPMAGALVKEADLEAWRAEHPGQPDPPTAPEVGLFPLEPGANGIILERALEFAKKRGVENPDAENEIYNYGKAVWRCLLGVVDPDSDPAHPEPFFDKGLEQILGMRELGQDGILFLSRAHESYMGEISSEIREVTDAFYQQAVEEVIGPAGFPFWCSLHPALQWNCMRFTALLLSDSRRPNSGSGTDSAPTGENGSAPSTKSRRKRARRTTSSRGSKGEE